MLSVEGRQDVRDSLLQPLTDCHRKQKRRAKSHPAAPMTEVPSSHHALLPPPPRSPPGGDGCRAAVVSDYFPWTACPLGGGRVRVVDGMGSGSKLLGLTPAPGLPPCGTQGILHNLSGLRLPPLSDGIMREYCQVGRVQ